MRMDGWDHDVRAEARRLAVEYRDAESITITPGDTAPWVILAQILESAVNEIERLDPFGSSRPGGALESVAVRRTHPRAILPTRAHSGDAGLDLYALEDASNEDRLVTSPDAHLPVRVRTGVAVEIPEGYVGMVSPRSGLAASRGITVANAPGIIDSGFTGEIQVLLCTTGFGQTVRVSRGERIAQLVIVPVATPDVFEVDVFEGSERGDSGFGSTGD